MRIKQTMIFFVLMTFCLCSTTNAQLFGSKSKGSGTKLLTKTYQIKFETSAGDFYVEVHPEWAPIGQLISKC